MLGFLLELRAGSPCPSSWWFLTRSRGFSTDCSVVLFNAQNRRRSHNLRLSLNYCKSLSGIDHKTSIYSYSHQPPACPGRLRPRHLARIIGESLLAALATLAVTSVNINQEFPPANRRHSRHCHPWYNYLDPFFRPFVALGRNATQSRHQNHLLLENFHSLTTQAGAKITLKVSR